MLFVPNSHLIAKQLPENVPTESSPALKRPDLALQEGTHPGIEVITHSKYARSCDRTGPLAQIGKWILAVMRFALAHQTCTLLPRESA